MKKGAERAGSRRNLVGLLEKVTNSFRRMDERCNFVVSGLLLTCERMVGNTYYLK